MLDQVFLVSNSDAHSLDKLGREANVFDMKKPSYDELFRILSTKDASKFIETIEFFPEEGKYHIDGHRACDFCCLPAETKRLKGACPKCGKPLTVGVLSRVDALADRVSDRQVEVQGQGNSPRDVPFRSIIPLAELIGSVLDVGPSSKKVAKEVDRLVREGRTEFGILLDELEKELVGITSPEIVSAILAMRRGDVDIHPGYDGVYGVIKAKITKKMKQVSMM